MGRPKNVDTEARGQKPVDTEVESQKSEKHRGSESELRDPKLCGHDLS